MLTAVRMVPLRVWNCSLGKNGCNSRREERTGQRGGASLKTGGRYRPGRRD